MTDKPDVKTCPSCAETIKAAAIRCRYCGYDFENKNYQNTPVQPKSNKEMVEQDPYMSLSPSVYLLTFAFCFILTGFVTRAIIEPFYFNHIASDHDRANWWLCAGAKLCHPDFLAIPHDTLVFIATFVIIFLPMVWIVKLFIRQGKLSAENK